MYQRDFDFSLSNNISKLSVVLMADSFFYSLYENDGKLIAHHSYTDIKYSDPQTIDTILSDATLQKKYSQIAVAVLCGDTHQIDISDVSLFNLYPGLELKNKKIEQIPGQTVYNYFGISRHQEDLLRQLFGDGNYKLSSFTSLLAGYFVGLENHFLHLHVEDGIIFLYVQKSGQLYLYNTYLTNSVNDILYFVLSNFQHCGLDPLADSLSISGWVEEESLLFKQLQGYISNLHILQDPTFGLHTTVTTDVKSHYYFVHNINALCAS